MSSHLGYLLLGLGAGSAIAALGLGLVMVYRASGVINLAQGALGMFVALAFFNFRETGDVTLPLVGLPASFHVLQRPTLATALAVFIPYGLVLGAVVYLLVFRPLRRSPPLAQVVASVGLFLYLWAVAELRFPGEVMIRTIVDDSGLNVFGRLVTSDQFYVAAMVAAVSGALWLVGNRTRFGLATTAAAENERGAVLAGLRPDLLALGNWSLAVCLAGTFTILAAQITRLDPLTTSLAVVPALAAALLGGFRSYGAVVIGGLVLGMGASELTNLQADHTWVPQVGWQQGLPLLVILGVMLLRGRPLPDRGALAAVRFPGAPQPRHAVVVAAVGVPLAAAAMFAVGPDLRSGLIASAIAAVISLSVVVLTGWVGQISLAPLAFAGVAGFALVRLSAANLGLLAPVLAVVVATAVGVLVGLPAARVRGMSLAIATLAAAVAIEELLFKWSWFTGGVEGVRAPKLSLWCRPVDLGAGCRISPSHLRGGLCGGVRRCCSGGGGLAAVPGGGGLLGGSGQRAGRRRGRCQRVPGEADGFCGLGGVGRGGWRALGLSTPKPVGTELSGVRLVVGGGADLSGRDHLDLRCAPGRRTRTGRPGDRPQRFHLVVDYAVRHQRHGTHRGGDTCPGRDHRCGAPPLEVGRHRTLLQPSRTPGGSQIRSGG